MRLAAPLRSLVSSSPSSRRDAASGHEKNRRTSISIPSARSQFSAGFMSASVMFLGQLPNSSKNFRSLRAADEEQTPLTAGA